MNGRGASLLALGRDIFVMYILPQLEARDLNSLRLTCQELNQLAEDPAVWHAVYNAMFPADDAKPDIAEPITDLEGWEKRCAMRSAAKFLAWGSSEAGRLGISLKNVAYGFRGQRGVNRPVRVPAFDDMVVSDVSCGGFFTAVLSAGDIYVVGDLQGQLRGAGPPMQLRVAGDSDEKFAALSCGRSHIVAKTCSDKIVVWHATRETPGRILDFGPTPVGKFTAGWSSSAVVVADLGIAIWSVDAVPDDQGKIEHFFVPHTGKSSAVTPDYGQDAWQVADLAVGGGFAAFTTNNGKLFAVRLDFEEGNLRPPEYVASIHEAVGGSGIAKVTASLNRLVAITSDGRIVQTQWQSDHFDEIEVFELPGVVQIAVGDHHCLALTETGELYSWGTEPHSCGALGMGPPADIEAAGGETRPIRWFASDSTVSKPTRIATVPMYRISAGGWHCAAIGLDSTELRAEH